MFAPLKQRNFALLWFGQLISMIGDWVLLIALPFHIYNLTGSALATGAMFMASALPRLLLGSVAGVFADRWDRRRMMIVADVLRALVLLPLLFVQSADLIWVIYVVAFVMTVISQFFFPAKSAIIPQLVGERELLAANSLTAVSDSVTRLIGPSLGGALLAWSGLTSVVIVDAVSFIVSGVMIWLIVMPPCEGVVIDTQSITTTSPLAKWMTFWREWLAGLRFVKGAQTLVALFVVTSVMTFADSIFTALMVPFAQNIMHITSLELGWLMTAQGIGGLVGGLLMGRMTKRFSPQRLIMLAGFVDGLILLGIINSASLPIALVLIAIAGLPMVGMMVSINTLVQLGATDAYRGRVMGAFMTTSALTNIIGLALAGALGDILNIVIVLNLAAVLWLLVGVTAWWLMTERTTQPKAVTVSEPA
jgi:MFS family permease